MAITPEITNWAGEQLASGYTRTHVSAMLKGQGWSKEDIEQILEGAKPAAKPSAPPKPGSKPTAKPAGRPPLKMPDKRLLLAAGALVVVIVAAYFVFSSVLLPPPVAPVPTPTPEPTATPAPTPEAPTALPEGSPLSGAIPALISTAANSNDFIGDGAIISVMPFAYKFSAGEGLNMPPLPLDAAFYCRDSPKSLLPDSIVCTEDFYARPFFASDSFDCSEDKLTALSSGQIQLSICCDSDRKCIVVPSDESPLLTYVA